jgi:integrase
MATFIKRGKKWRAQIRINGKSYSKTGKTKGEVQEWAKKKEMTLANSRDIDPGERTMKELFETFRESKTARNDINRLKLLEQDRLGRVKLKDLCADDIEEYRDRRCKEISGASVRRYLNDVSSALTMAVKKKWVPHNICRDVEFPADSNPREREISKAEIDKLLETIGWDGESVTMVKHQIAIMILLAVETGMRLGEIVNLERNRIYLEEQKLYLDKTKSKPRWVSLSTEAVRLIKLLPRRSDRLFTTNADSASNMFGRYVKQAGIKNLTFHDTRHEAATRLTEQLNPFELAAQLGHSNLKQTMDYYNKNASRRAAKLN